MKKVIETERTYLRELKYDDFQDLCKLLQDENVMTAFDHALNPDEVLDWLHRQMKRYQNDGFGMWAVIEKKTNLFLGQAGLTWQECEGEQVLDVSFVFLQKFWHRGFATETAQACVRYAFDNLGFDRVTSTVRSTIEPGKRVAERIGMTHVKDFQHVYQGVEGTYSLYSISKKQEQVP
ncbi:GNAT family N-acetyltransferase [Feifania hominis]|uniref:GNAT family N-acetyltransferase n=1 Tax=Feifania hominis TaxID=2763660 RepID=A0A926DFQ0_9FIRM|nr:GNAT family N-acetyltransferase [Feifania hominis]MBC8537011.1 GNAT family N-acetyltransferase [Feifania hominis]